VTKEDDAFWQGALNCCAVAVTIFFVIWVILSPLRAPTCPPASTAVAVAPPAPAPAPVQTTEDRQELLTRQLCDKEVAILLESRDLADLIRAATVIHQVNCGIEKRL
jgi:hypothetical protein